VEFLRRTCTPDFYGEIRIRVRAGEVVKVVVEQDYLVSTLPGGPGEEASATT